MIRIIDNFYANPDEVREFALKEKYSVYGNYPGKRTKPYANEEHKKQFEEALGMKIQNWNMRGSDENTYNGAFQIANVDERTWIHHDATACAAVVYLTPNAPLSGGTAIYRHKSYNTHKLPSLETFYKKNINKKDYDDLLGKDGLDTTKWEEIDFLGNVYNRCVIYEGIYYHSSLDYWGREEDPLSEQRLFQVFFFNTDKLPWCYNDGDGNVWWNKYENEEYEELDYDRIL